MKFSIEAKIGIIGVATLVVLIWGINYLKGRNILSNSYLVEAYLDAAEDLDNSAPVLMKGVKIGYVRTIALRMDEDPPIKCVLSLEKAYPIRKGSVAILYSADLLGTKAIRIEPSEGQGFLKSGDTLKVVVEPDLLSSLQEQLTPVIHQVGSLAASMDTLSNALEEVIGSDEIRGTLENLREISASISRTLHPGGSLHQSFVNLAAFSEMLKEQDEELESMSRHFSSFSESLDNAHIDQLSANLIEVTHQFDRVLKQIGSGEGSAGKLIYTDSLYNNLNLLVTDLDLLIKDLNENPQEYVHFSLFGKSQKKSD
jgi:phospholipid/cholesterol/gamma-HCH transport system substrate-binding protein